MNIKYFSRLAFDIFTNILTLFRSFDEDGYFYLLEDPDELPQWANQATLLNRVFLKNGEVVILGQPQTPAQLAFFPPLVQRQKHEAFSATLLRAMNESEKTLSESIRALSLFPRTNAVVSQRLQLAILEHTNEYFFFHFNVDVCVVRVCMIFVRQMLYYRSFYC